MYTQSVSIRLGKSTWYFSSWDNDNTLQ